MNARDIIKLAAQLYVHEEFKKKHNSINEHPKR